MSPTGRRSSRSSRAPCGARLDKAAIDADLRTAAGGLRPQSAAADRAGRGRSARRPSARADARFAARARRSQPRPRELGVGDEPVAAGGRAVGQGREAGDTAAARSRGLCRHAQVRPRGRPRRARACERAAHRRARRGRRGREGAARARSGSRCAARWSTRRSCARASTRPAPTATRSAAIVEVRATGVPPGLGSYASKADRLDARLAAAVMGIQAVKGVEIGDGFALAALRGERGARRDPAAATCRETNRAGGIEAGVSNGEELVVRAAMKPLPTLMKPLRSVDLATGEAGAGARRAERRRCGRGARGRRRGGRRVRARARRAREVRRRRARRLRRRAPRVPGADPVATARPRPAPRARRLHGRRQVDARRAGRRAARPAVRRPRRRARAATGQTIPRALRGAARRSSATRGAKCTVERCARRRPAVLALGGGALGSAQVRDALRETRSPCYVEVDAEEAWAARSRRAAGRSRRTSSSFRALFTKRRAGCTPRSRTRIARDVDDVVLAAGGGARRGRRARAARRARSAGDGPVALVSDARVAGIHGADAQVALGGAARLGARAAGGRGGEDDRRGRQRLWRRAPARPRRAPRRARRRLHDRRRGLRRGDVSPRHSLGRGPDDARRARSTPRSAARRRSISPRGRTSSARSTGRRAP